MADRRWIVRVVSDPSSHVSGLHVSGRGRGLRSFARYAAAKRYAQRVAYDYQYGVVVDDTREQIVDHGSEWSDYNGRPIAAPHYARKNPHAVALGRRGGKARSAAKTAAARANGRQGGRPRRERVVRIWSSFSVLRSHATEGVSGSATARTASGPGAAGDAARSRSPAA